MSDRARREEIYSGDLAPYVDLLAIPDGREPVAGWLQQVDPLAGIVFTAPAPDAAAGDPARVVDGALRDLGTEVVMHAWRAVGRQWGGVARAGVADGPAHARDLDSR